MTAQDAPPSPAVLRCRQCSRPLEDSRRVYCGDACLATHDNRAAVLVEHVAARRQWIGEQVSELDHRIEQLQADRRRVVGGAEADLAETETTLAHLKAHLHDARNAGEARLGLASDQPARPESARFA